ncbi:MAG: hypothetical protein IIY55_03715 [Blautia sp.]|nr:hypothetical protein [Blautia sp.]
MVQTNMDQTKVKQTVGRMTEARAALLRENPFFGHLAMGLQLACASCGTACTDGSRLIFDPEFAEELSDRELQFVILHEVLHCVLMHCIRGRGLHTLLYNIACDIVVNSIILDMWGIGSIMIGGEEAIHLAPNGKEGRVCDADEIYHMLLAGPDKNIPGNGCFPACDRHDLWQGICGRGQLQDTWNERIRKAVKACGDTTGMPMSIRRVVKSLERRSGLDWKQLLHDFIQYDQYDYSFIPPDRRYVHTDFYLPSYNVDEENGSVGEIWVCVDTSASITREELESAVAEILDAMRQTELKGMISFFDSNITEPVPFETEADIMKIEPSGGGGTSFRVIFDFLKEKLSPELPRAILIFTDGIAAWPKESAALSVPVLWLITGTDGAAPPWGRMVNLKGVHPGR